jgi:hypothetical protein
MRTDINTALDDIESVFGDMDEDQRERVETVLEVLHSAAYEDGFSDGQNLSSEDSDANWD